MVAIAGSRVAVGAFKDSIAETSAGITFVYDVSSGTPGLPVATLTKPTSSAFDYFGTSVAISGTRVVVGAPNDDIAGPNAGSAYVFDLAGANPFLPVSTLASSSPASDSFGWSVAVSGARVVVGLPMDNQGGFHAGKALVYDLASSTPACPVLILANPLPSQEDDFGWSVAISGKWVVVGAYSDDTMPGNTGSAYVYDLGSATPGLPMLTLTNPSPAIGADFGLSVAISGTRIVIGAPQDSTGAFLSAVLLILTARLRITAAPTFSACGRLWASSPPRRASPRYHGRPPRRPGSCCNTQTGSRPPTGWRLRAARPIR